MIQTKTAFQKIKPAYYPPVQLTQPLDYRKYKKKDGEWFDRTTKNPGQLGVSIKIAETMTNTVGPMVIKVDQKDKPWNLYKKEQTQKKLKKKKKPKKVKDPEKPEMYLSQDQLKRFNKNMVTVELSNKDYSIKDTEATSDYHRSNNPARLDDSIKLPKI